MLTVYENGVGYPILNDDYYIRELASGYDEIVFNVDIRDPVYQYINEEAVVRDRDQNIYLIKQIDAGEQTAKVVAQINLDDWKQTLHMDYSNNSATVAATVSGLLPTGWNMVDYSNITKRRTVPTSDTTTDFNVTALEVLEACTSIYSVRFRFNTATKTISIINPNNFQPAGAFATRDLNLKKLNYKGKSDSFATRLYATGKDGMTFASINNGKSYVENFSYSNKVISAYWGDERYTDAQSLLEDATAKLAEMAQPTRSYDCDILDLANTNPEIYGFEDFSLFSVITLVDDAKEARTNYQVVERWTYPYYPVNNKVILSTSTPNIQSVIAKVADAIDSSTSSFSQIMQSAIANATELITGNNGGYVVFHDSNGDGTPDEILIMDTPSIETAIKVWRWNKQGLGYSNHGYNPPAPYGYELGMTIDGSIVATMITSGTLNADVIRAGLLTDTLGNNYWNLETGEFKLAAGTAIGNSTVASASDVSGAITTAESYADSALNTWVTNTYNTDKTALEGQIDGKAETWYQAADPATAWTTATDKQKHVGDLWYNTTNDTTWYYSYDSPTQTYSWEQQNVPQAVFDEIDGKAQIFIAQPTPPYNVGDLWCKGTSDGIYNCVTAKAAGESYSDSDWQVKNNYVDQSDVNTSISTYDTSLNQREVFKKLTNNGQAQGILLDANGDLYINGTWIQANTIAANALSVQAQESLKEHHSYLDSAIYSDISLWHNDNSNVPFSYQTIDDETYLELDCTGVSSGSTWSDAVYTPIGLVGDGKIKVHYEFYIDRAVTLSAAQRFPCIRFKNKNTGNYNYVYITLSAQTIPANEVFTHDLNFTVSNVDATAEAQFGFYPIQGAKVYIRNLTAETTLDVYASAGITFNNEGLSSTVQKNGVISAINQSAEQVSISASKIDLAGDLDLHGTFTTDTSPTVSGYKAKLDSASLKFLDNSDTKIMEVCPQYLNGVLTFGLFLYDNNSFIGITNNGTILNNIIINGELRVQPANNEWAYIQADTQFSRNVYNDAGGVVFISDQRKKRNIKDLVITKAKSFIMSLKPRIFRFKEGISTSGRYHHGFIAQEVKKAMSEDWGVYVENKDIDFIGLRYDELIADMVAVIQDQEKRIEALERRLDDLTNNKS